MGRVGEKQKTYHLKFTCHAQRDTKIEKKIPLRGYLHIYCFPREKKFLRTYSRRS